MVYKPKDCQACEVALFCTPCIDNLVKTNQDPNCPSCHQNEGFRDLHKRVLRHLNEYQVYCIRKDCPKKNKAQGYEDLCKSHPEECVQK